MAEKKIIREFPLIVRHYEGDQTKEELYKPCEMCLFCHFYDCLLFNAPLKESLRSCTSNYRIDQETLIDAMRSKLKKDGEDFAKWINSYKDYMGDEEGLIVMDSPNAIIKVHEELEKKLGD